MPLAAVLGTEPFVIPDGIDDLASFREWVHNTDLPEKLPVHYLRGHVWVDYEMEEVFSHNRVKYAFHLVLGNFVRANKLGVLYPDGMRYTSLDAEASTEPDATFVSAETIAAERIEFTAGPKGVATEMLGTPDLVVEVVSRTSTDKDTDWLKDIYFKAGIPEYWLIDARDRDAIQFDIFTRGRKAYRATKPSSGWVKSAVFGKEFRLRVVEEYGLADCVLDIR